MKVIGEFTKAQLAALGVEMGKIDKIDPASPNYQSIVGLLNNLDQKQLKQIEAAGIKFLSNLARNRIRQEAE